jgi:hypothetical protein
VIVRSGARGALTIGLAIVAVVGSALVPTTASAASPVPAVPVFLGPVVSQAETPTAAIGRDLGISVGLPNGKDLWIFGDTPGYRFMNGAWKLMSFISGSSAGMIRYTPGKRFTTPLFEVIPGKKLAKANKPTQFLPTPLVYLPDGSGRVCTKANGGNSAGMARWPTGAALMPDKTNVFVPYMDVCVVDAANYQIEGWGFAFYNWKTNKVGVPVDVIKPQVNGAPIPQSQYYRSPVVIGNTLTLFTETCCAPASVSTTTIPTNLFALANPASYVSNPIPGMGPPYMLSVSGPTKTQPHLTMYQALDTQGHYGIYTASAPSGPWTQTTSGYLPRCVTATVPCNSIALHPELSSKTRLIVSYYVTGYGPGVGKHPDPSQQISHVVWASLPV